MAKKKDTEVEIIDIENGVEVRIGKKAVAEIKEESGTFVVTVSGKEIAVARSFEDGLEEAIKAYNLTV